MKMWLPLGAATAAALGPGPNGLARTPPMGWMSWQRFRCETNCTEEPDACINEALYKSTADAIAAGGADSYLAAGYSTVSIDDCWEGLGEGRERDPTTHRLLPDADRFPGGMKALGAHLRGLGVRFGIYSDEGTRTCGGFPGSEGYEAVDAATFAEWGVSYLKLDGCYSNKSNFVTGYPAMGAALQATGANITYSCSWPAYLGGNESAKPFAAMIAAGCNSWRNWEDIQCDYGVMAAIIGHWGEYAAVLQKWAGPGHWHDPDMLLIGNGCLTTAEEQTQMAIWSITASPLIMGNDVRNVSAASAAILKNADAIAVDQDARGLMGGRLSTDRAGAQTWARQLSGGAVAVGLYNTAGGTPAGLTELNAGAYCGGGRVAVDGGSGFGHSLASCRDGVLNATANPKCSGAIFDYNQGYNGQASYSPPVARTCDTHATNAHTHTPPVLSAMSGAHSQFQCTCATDDCSTTKALGGYNIYRITPGSPPIGIDIAVDLGAVGLEPAAGRANVEVYDIWSQSVVGVFPAGSNYTATNVALHGTAFLRLTPK